MLVRRRGERLSFLASLRSPDFSEASVDQEFFRVMVSLAVNDYGVSRKRIAETLGTSEATIGRWAAGASLPPLYIRRQIGNVIAIILESDLLRDDPTLADRGVLPP